jgi:ABC-type sugar transport system permease subunit
VSAHSGRALARREARLAWALIAPVVVVLVAVAVAPLLATLWESLHRHDLRLPWTGQPFVGLLNYREAAGDPRFLASLRHTVAFTVVSVGVETAMGLVLAIALDRLTRGRALARVAVLLPWALPTVVAALVWRFMFDTDGVVNGLLSAWGLAAWRTDWLAGPVAAWVPIILGDAWKTTPFVALLLLAGLQTIDPALYEAARLDGAGGWRRFTQVTLPLLRPALFVALVFRTLDAFRVFDLVFVLTGGGPGTATEVVSVTTFAAMLQDLRFGYAAALSIVIFAVSFALALVYIRMMTGRTVARSEAVR